MCVVIAAKASSMTGFLMLLYCTDYNIFVYVFILCFFFQAEDGIRDLVRSRGLGDVYKRQAINISKTANFKVPGVVDVGVTANTKNGVELDISLSLIHI